MRRQRLLALLIGSALPAHQTLERGDNADNTQRVSLLQNMFSSCSSGART